MELEGRTSVLAIITAILFLVGGLVLTGGGGYLVILGGSWYYLIAGLALLAAGYFTARGRPLGPWIYIAAFGLTIIWAMFEAGGDLWAWVPRYFGPFLLFLLAVCVIPTLRPRAFGWAVASVISICAVVITSVAGTMMYDPLRGGLRAALPEATASVEARTDWPAYGGRLAERYSTLDEINTDTVAGLERVWTAHTGDLPDDLHDNSYGAETTPLKIGDRLYLCSATNILIALDAASGEEVWRHDPQLDHDWIPYTAACRGVAYYEGTGPARISPPMPADTEGTSPEDGSDEGPEGERIQPVTPAAPQPALAEENCPTRIIEGTLDGRLIAVDAETGEPCIGFGENGSVDIKQGMGPVVPGMVAITAAPTIVNGVIVTGHQVLDGQKLDAPSGVIQGFDVMTGELLWAWDMTHPEWDSLPPEGEAYTRGTPNMWTAATGDNELGLVYLPMGNSAVDYWSGSRTDEENAYSTSLVAIDVTSGKPAWSFQTVHKDVWDYDLGSQVTLIDFPGTSGQSVPALILPSKQGDIYILDRATGEPLTGVEERNAPQGGVEPDERSPTQPHSLYHTLAFPELREKDMWGMSPIDQMFCRIGFRKAEYEGMYTPPSTGKHWIQYPGYNGGSDWGSVAVDPARGVIIANYNDMPNHNELVPRATADEKGWAPRGDARGGKMSSSPEGAGDPQVGAPYAIDVNAGWRAPFTGLLCKEPPYGGMRAIDIATGETIWDRDLGTARRNGPFNIPTGLPLVIGTPNNGGPLVTAGNLVFVAATTDNLIRAIDIRTGETVWKDVLPAGGQATPMTYEAGGRQYLVLMTGGHHFMETPVGDDVIAWALPQD